MTRQSNPVLALEKKLPQFFLGIDRGTDSDRWTTELPAEWEAREAAIQEHLREHPPELGGIAYVGRQSRIETTVRFLGADLPLDERVLVRLYVCVRAHEWTRYFG